MLPKNFARNNRSNATYKFASYKLSGNLFIESSKAFAVLILLSAYLFGQSQLADKTADQSLRSNGRVNPSTLGMEIDIPLMSYPGRGMSVPVSLSYSSKLWQLKAAGAQPGNPITNCDEMPHPTFAEDSASGWTTSLARPILEYTGRDNIYTDKGHLITDSGCNPTGSDDWSYIKRLTVHLPGGGSVELRASETPEFYPRASNCNDNDPNTPCPNNLPSKQENWDTVYYAVNGSGMKYVENSASSPNPTYRLYMPDGSYYDFGGLETKSLKEPNIQVRKGTTHTDRHGNSKTYHAPTSQNQSQYPNGYWQDTLGRIIPIPLTTDAPGQANVQEYKIPGFGGGSSVLTYKLHWKKLEDALQSGEILKYAGNYQFLTQLCPTQTTSCSTLFNGGVGIQSGGSINRVRPQPQYDSQAQPVKFNPVILAKVELPNGQFYDFKYNSFGEIAQIEYPTGGIEQFTYDKVSPLGRINKGYDDANRGVSLRKLYENSAATPLEWTYYSGADGQGYFITTVNPDGTYSKSFLHRGNWNFSYTGEWGTWGYDYILPGRVYDVSNYSSDNNLVSKKLTQWEYTSASYGVNYAQRQARVAQEQNFSYDASGNAVYATTKYEYHNASGHSLQDISTPVLVKSVKEYAYVPSTGNTVGGNSPVPSGSPNPNPPSIPTVNPPTLLRTTETEYVTTDANYSGPAQQAYKDRNLISLVSMTVVKDGAGTPKAKSQIMYDESTYLEAVTTTNLPPSWTNPSSNYRGLPTTSRSWYDIGNNYYIDMHVSFDQFGNSRKNWDGKGNSAETEYDSTYRTYPVTVTSAIPDLSGQNGSYTAFVTTSTFDSTTGLPLTTTDANGKITTMSYADPVTLQVDPLLRIRKVTSPNNHQTISEYGTGTSSATRFTKVKTQIDTNNWKEAISWFDGLGRTNKSQTIDSGGDIFVEKEFDFAGREKRVSNRYRTGETVYWTENIYDEAGRVKEVKTLDDNAKVQTAYTIAATGSDIGTVITVTDQSGKQRRSITNALGHLSRVDEPTDANGLGAITSPNQPTNYTYDILGNLLTVSQGTQTRTFVYDSLSRMKSADNPESGVISYTYDNNGNLQTRRDARDIKTIYDYDNLNRVIKKCYRILTTNSLGSTTCANTGSETIEPNTSAVNYVYDNLSNARGKLIKVENALSKTEYQSFDEMGRVTQSQQFVDGVTYPEMTYTYNLSGALVEQKYPSGRVVKNVLDSDGDLSIVQSKKNQNAGFWNYADNFTYTAAGAVKSMQLGNGRWESTQYNSRLQPIQIALGSVQNATDKLKLDYSYGTTNNNGNILSQTITVPTETRNSQIFNAFTAVQTYTYDSLNRLKSATENIDGNSTPAWKQTFDYDRYGNRTFNEANTTASLNFPKTCSGTMCAADKKIFNPQAQTSNNKFSISDGYQYDLSGNTTRDAQSRKFTYDAENKQTKVETVDSNGNVTATLGEYFYDGDGKRVKKYVPGTGETTIFIYDAGGKLVAENSTLPSPAQTVSYLTNDHLGSPRINTNQNSIVTARHDYQPFGEEIQRISYGSDNVRKQFTGYEKDSEIELNFAQARYQNAYHGRFTSPDPLLASATTTNPQTFNRYNYVINNPLNLIDPLGLDDCDPKKEKCITEGGLVYESCGEPGTEGCDPLKFIITVIEVSISDTPETPIEATIMPEISDIISYSLLQDYPAMGNRPDSPPPPPPPPYSRPNTPCFQIGLNYSAFAGAGLGAGGAADVGVTVAQDRSGGDQVTFVAPAGGGFFGGTGNGASVGYPSGNGIAVGAAASTGPGIFFSNASNPDEQTGVFDTEVFATPLVTIQRDQNPTANPPTTNITISGPSAGAGYFRFQTNTARPLTGVTGLPGCTR